MVFFKSLVLGDDLVGVLSGVTAVLCLLWLPFPLNPNSITH